MKFERIEVWACWLCSDWTLKELNKRHGRGDSSCFDPSVLFRRFKPRELWIVFADWRAVNSDERRHLFAPCLSGHVKENRLRKQPCVMLSQLRSFAAPIYLLPWRAQPQTETKRVNAEECALHDGERLENSGNAVVAFSLGAVQSEFHLVCHSRRPSGSPRTKTGSGGTFLPLLRIPQRAFHSLFANVHSDRLGTTKCVTKRKNIQRKAGCVLFCARL